MATWVSERVLVQRLWIQSPVPGPELVMGKLQGKKSLACHLRNIKESGLGKVSASHPREAYVLFCETVLHDAGIYLCSVLGIISTYRLLLTYPSLKLMKGHTERLAHLWGG